MNYEISSKARIDLINIWEYTFENWSHAQKTKTMTKKDKIVNAKTFDELLDIEYGKVGTAKRNEFEEQAQYFVMLLDKAKF